MTALRTPGTGCPWDLEQNFATIAPYTLEEAYEVADAIARGDLTDLREELGDLLLQVVFHARMAQGTRRLRFRRCRAGDHGEAHSPAPARFRSGARPHPQGGRRIVGAHQGRGKGRAESQWTRRRRTRRCARRRAGDAPCPYARAEAASQGRKSRIRLERPDAVLARSARTPTRSNPRSPRTIAPKPARKSAISCSPWSISPATWMPIRKRFCARPTGNSSAASARSSTRSPNVASRPSNPRSPKWTRSGMPPSSKKAAGKIGEALARAQAHAAPACLMAGATPRRRRADIADQRSVRPAARAA